MQWYSPVILLVLVAAVAAQETYSPKFDSIDTCAIVKNTRLFTNYKNCMLAPTNVGCPQDAVELKKVMGEGLKTTCAKCSPVQQTKVKETLECMCAERPADFAELIQHWDPNNEYRPAFEAKFGKLSGEC